VAPIPYIPTIDGPTGDDRPIPTGVNYYNTPAIYINNPTTGTKGAIAQAETNQNVVAEIGNLGDTAAAGELIVQFWAAGFGTTSGFSASLSSEPEGVTAAAPAVPAGSTGVEVSVPWRPQTDELGGLAEKHFCIRANVFLASRPGDKLNDGNLVDVPAEKRHGQKNMTLVPKGTVKKDFMFELATANLDPEQPQEFALQIVEVTGPLEPPEIFHIQNSPWVLRADERDGLILRDSDGRIEVKPAIDRPDARISLTLGDDTGSRLEAYYEPGEERPITMRVIFGDNDDDEDGLLRRFDIVQHGSDGVVGAARVITISVPEDMLEPAGDKPGKAAY